MRGLFYSYRRIYAPRVLDRKCFLSYLTTNTINSHKESMVVMTVAHPLVLMVNVERKDVEEGSDTITLLDVMKNCIRPDIVEFMHSNMGKNKCQPYTISKKVDNQTSAES